MNLNNNETLQELREQYRHALAALHSGSVKDLNRRKELLNDVEGIKERIMKKIHKDDHDHDPIDLMIPCPEEQFNKGFRHGFELSEISYKSEILVHRIIVIVLIALALLYASSRGFAQTAVTIPQKTAGQELQTASNRFYIGISMASAGSLSALILSSRSGSYRQPALFASGAVAIAGAFFMLEAPIHLKRAGRRLDGISLVVDPSHISLKYRF